jgi:hypothetical protein
MNSRTMIGKHNPIANQLRAGTNQPKVIPNKKRGLKPMADELLSFIVPSYHVTSCQNCPSAEYSEYYGTTECSEVYDESLVINFIEKIVRVLLHPARG